MKKHPIIIAAPHSTGTVPTRFKNRLALSRFELWQMHDPFTDQTCEYPRAYAIHKGKNHRAIVDLNRSMTAKDLFREEDFYGRTIWKDGESLSDAEKEKLVKKYWAPFRASIRATFASLVASGCKKILFIDHHNTAVDHPANHGQYLPPINLGNFGDEDGESEKGNATTSPEVINDFASLLEAQFPGVTVEVNKVYKGSSLVRFAHREIGAEFPDCDIQAIHLEYNLNLIFNPISKRVDDVAKKILRDGINQGLKLLIEKHFL